ncbi:MAG: hypothetical protein HC884_14755, partial [Chloroflexaceae bacterium]|nr:hypothetical protein [Chloroflexaceae bacterium]
IEKRSGRHRHRHRRGWEGRPTCPPGRRHPPGRIKLALIALTTTILVVLQFCTGGIASCLIPFAPLVMGIVAVVQSKNAANPDRARTYGWISVIAGSLPIIIFIVIMVIYGGAIIAAISSGEFN